MAKRGPKSGFNEKLQDVFVRLSKEGKTLEEIADVIGVSSRTLTRWMGAHQDLCLAVREARQVADELVEAALFGRACGYSHPEERVAITKLGDVIPYTVEKRYPPDTQAAMFWLRNRQPERWKEKADGADVNVTQSVNVNGLSDADLDARIAKLLGNEKS